VRDDSTWPCGHPKTDENTQSVGVGRVACRECRRRITREHAARKRNGGLSKILRDARHAEREAKIAKAKEG
jgi:hypothetical protein